MSSPWIFTETAIIWRAMATAHSPNSFLLELLLMNGIGDFDGDGDLDYLVAKGYSLGSIYFFEKQGPGNDFKAPVPIAAWYGDGGIYPNGMAVADYNGDGIMDFVLTYYYSTNATLYLGKAPAAEGQTGKLEFTPSVLENVAPKASNDADAADFNNDGYADFVVAPTSGSEFSINIGHVDGTFKTNKLVSYSNGSYWNVAVADFDNDGNVDLIASYDDYMDFYEGQGEVAEDEPQFIWARRIQDDRLLFSPIDNFDFDNDGTQDLIVGKYGDDYNVAVLLGKGDGETFTYAGSYGGGEGYMRDVIAAPSINEAKNVPPVAVIDYDLPPIIAGQQVTFDGLGSYDDDGEITSYVWNFGGDDFSTEGNSVRNAFVQNTFLEYPIEGITAQHVFSEAGEHTVTLTVTDDQGATHSIQTRITIDPLPVRVKFNPRTLNLKSKGKWIRVTIILPKKHKACWVDLTGVFSAADDVFLGFAVSDSNYGFLSKFYRKKKKCRRTIKVRFDRQEVIKGLMDRSGMDRSGMVKLRVNGRIMLDGKQTDFEGLGKIRLIQPKPMKKSKLLKLLSVYTKFKYDKNCKKPK
jgi:hypothetical protein